MRFADSLGDTTPTEAAIRAHGEKCWRQLNMLLYGVLSEKNGN